MRKFNWPFALLALACLAASTFAGAVAGQRASIREVTTDAVATNDHTLVVDCTASDRTQTLPAAPPDGFILRFKKVAAANTLTIARNGNEIDGVAANVAMTGEGDTWTLQYNATTTGWWTIGKILTAAGSGTVTSVAQTVPAELSVAGSPVTTTGTLALTWASGSGSKFIGTPAGGGAGAYAGRALVAGDIPTIAQSQVTSLTSDLAGKAPNTPDFLVKTADGGLTAERVVTDSTSITGNWAVAGQVALERAALTGDVTAAANGNATTIAADAVTDGKLRDSTALTVIGRSANSTGDPADISATAASGAVLRESGSVLGFGTVATAGLAADAVTYAKMQNVSAGDKMLGRISGSGDVEEIAVTAAGRAILDDATAADQLTTLGIPTPISGANGGTGVANTSKTITLGGNLTTSGAFATTLTATNTTTITMPTTGTLATLAGSEVLTTKTIQGGNFGASVTGNDTYAFNASPALTAYVSGQFFTFTAGTANTNACTLNVNGLGAKDIQKRASTALATGDITTGMTCFVVYNGTAFIILNPVVN